MLCFVREDSHIMSRPCLPCVFLMAALGRFTPLQANYQMLMDTFPEESQGSSAFESLSVHHRHQVKQPKTAMQRNRLIENVARCPASVIRFRKRCSKPQRETGTLGHTRIGLCSMDLEGRVVMCAARQSCFPSRFSGQWHENRVDGMTYDASHRLSADFRSKHICYGPTY